MRIVLWILCVCTCVVAVTSCHGQTYQWIPGDIDGGAFTFAENDVMDPSSGDYQSDVDGSHWGVGTLTSLAFPYQSFVQDVGESWGHGRYTGQFTDLNPNGNYWEVTGESQCGGNAQIDTGAPSGAYAWFNTTATGELEHVLESTGPGKWTGTITVNAPRDDNEIWQHMVGHKIEVWVQGSRMRWTYEPPPVDIWYGEVTTYQAAIVDNKRVHLFNYVEPQVIGFENLGKVETTVSGWVSAGQELKYGVTINDWTHEAGQAEYGSGTSRLLKLSGEAAVHKTIDDTFAGQQAVTLQPEEVAAAREEQRAAVEAAIQDNAP